MRVGRGCIALGVWLASACGGSDDEPQGTGSSSSSSTSDPASTSAAPNSTGVDSSTNSTSSGDPMPASSSTGDDASSTGALDGCEAPALEPGNHVNLSFEFDGLPRSYDLFVPSGYDGSAATPLVFNFHGFSSNPAQQTFFSDLDVDAEARGMLVVYPEGIESSWNAGGCCGQAMTDGIDDVGFVRALLESLTTTLCIDTDRVYATGMSNGGFLSHRLACEAADIIAAVGPVAGALVLPPEDCAPARPVPVLHFHGTADEVVPYAGSAGGFPSVEESLQGWADRNGCMPASSVTLEMDDVSCQTWDGCDDDATVTLCTLDGFGHCWPGQPFCLSGESSETVRANTMMLDLFEQHSL